LWSFFTPRETPRNKSSHAGVSKVLSPSQLQKLSNHIIDATGSNKGVGEQGVNSSFYTSQLVEDFYLD
jgi:hypothetical protein